MAQKPNTGHRPLAAATATHLALFVTQCLFASWPVAGKIALRALPSNGVVAFRVGGSALLLLLLRRAWGAGKTVEKSDYGRLALYGMVGIVLNQLLFVKGLQLSTAINAALLSITIPVFALLVSVALGRERLRWQKIAGVAVAASGVAYLIDPARADFSQGANAGNLLMIANSLAYAIYIAVSQDVFQRYGVTTALTWIFGFSALVTVPLGAWQMAEVSFSGLDTQVWLAVFYVVAVTASAYFLNAWALARVPPATVAVYIYLQPLLAIVLAGIVLGESLSRRTALAALLIFSGVALVIRRAPPGPDDEHDDSQ